MKTGHNTTALGIPSPCRPFIAGAAFLLLAAAASAQIGGPDPTFDTDGGLVLPNGGVGEYINAIDHAVNGDLLITGSNWDPVNFTPYVGGLPVWRRAADGTASASWGTAGLAYVDLPDSREEGQAMVAQSDGNVLIGGVRWTADTCQLLFVRLLANGSLDPAFGTGGIALITGDPLLVPAYAGGTSAEKGVKALHQNSDGSYTAVGTTAPQGGQSLTLGFVLRLTSSGSLDSGFGNGGYFFHGSSLDERFRDAEFFPDGSVLSGGTHGATDNSWVKVTASGSYDNAFGTSGVQLSPTATTRGVTSFVRDATGNLYALCKDVAFTEKQLLKFDATGTIVSSFGTNGSLAVSSFDEGRVEMDSQQRLVVWGRRSDNLMFAQQLNTAGTELDYVYIDAWPYFPFDYDFRVRAFDEDSDGNYVFGGLGFIASVNYDGWSIRLTTTGSNGTNEQKTPTNVLLFPNPASDRITLRMLNNSSSNVVLSIVDATGRAVHTYERSAINYTGTLDIDLRGLAAGSYDLILSDGKSTEHVRFVKQ